MAEDGAICLKIVLTIFGLGALLTVILLAVSLKTLESHEMAIIYDTVAKELDDDVQGEGLHNGPPGFSFIIFPSVYETLEFPDLQCLNKDGVLVELDVTFQYLTQVDNLKKIITIFKDHALYENVLELAGKAAVHQSCSQFNTSQFQSERAEFTAAVLAELTGRYVDLMADVHDLQINNIVRPSEYEAAIRSKERAREDILVAENERPQQLTQAGTVLLEAQTSAEITINKAESEARVILLTAEAMADATLNEYTIEAETYSSIKTTQSLDIEGLLSYLAVRTINSQTNPVYAALKSPAKTSYMSD